MSISIQNRKQGAISDGLEVDSGFRKASNKNINDRKRVRKLQRKILSSNTINSGMKIQINRFATPLRLL